MRKDIAMKTIKKSIMQIITFLVAILLIVSTGCSKQGEKPVDVDLSNRSYAEVRSLAVESQDVIHFGFDRRLETKEDVRMYVPLLKFLEQETGYQFKVHVAPANSSIVEELGQGKIEMAAIGTLGYLQAREKYGVLITVRGLNVEDKDKYKAAIVTLPDSSIKTMADINGRSFAFGDPASTQGHLIPMMMLSINGIELNTLNYYQYFSSHAEVANAVMSGRFDAGGLQDTLAKSLEAKGLLKIVAMSEEFPSSGIAFAPGVDKEIITSITEALLIFEPNGKDSANLYHWEMSEMPNGFTKAGDEDYNTLREWAGNFGLLEKADGGNK